MIAAVASSPPPPIRSALEASDSMASLADRIRAGDATAEAELVQRFGRGLRIFLRQQTRDPELADDLYQSTFYVVLERLRTRELQDPTSLGAFIRGTARNLFRNEARKRARRRTDGDERLDELVDWAQAGSPLDRLLRSEKAALVRRLLIEIRNPRDREVLVRVYLAEDDMDEISQDLDLELEHFYRVLWRARQRLKQLLLERESGLSEDWS